jgi:hypothetical protein
MAKLRGFDCGARVIKIGFVRPFKSILLVETSRRQRYTYGLYTGNYGHRRDDAGQQG